MNLILILAWSCEPAAGPAPESPPAHRRSAAWIRFKELIQAEECFQNQKFEDALSILSDAQAHPDHAADPNLGLLRARCLGALNRHHEAAVELAGVLEREPYFSEAYLELARNRFRLGKPGAGEGFLALARELESRAERRQGLPLSRLPHELAEKLKQAMIHADRGLVHDALMQFREVRRLAPAPDPLALASEGDLLARIHRYREAQELLRAALIASALDPFPAAPQARLQLALTICRLNREDPEAANVQLAELKNSIADPDERQRFEVEAIRRLFEVQTSEENELNRLISRIAASKTLEDAGPLYLELALYHLNSGNPAAARVFIELARSLQPESILVHQAIHFIRYRPEEVFFRLRSSADILSVQPGNLDARRWLEEERRWIFRGAEGR